MAQSCRKQTRKHAPKANTCDKEESTSNSPTRGGAAARSRERKAHLGALVRLRENHARNVPAWLPVERGRLTHNGPVGRCETPRDLTLRMRSAHFFLTSTSRGVNTPATDCYGACDCYVA